MHFEGILEEVGGFHRFQFLVLHILCIPRVVLPLHFLLHNFISAVPQHHCTLVHLDRRYGDSTPLPLPQDPDGSQSSCRQFPEPDNVTSSGSGSNETVPCQHGWTYDQSLFKSTTATEWDLVCDSKNLNQALATFFFMGVMTGAVLFGYLADRVMFGRKPMLLLSFVSSCVFGVAAAFSTSFLMFAISRTLSGVALTGMTITTVSLSNTLHTYRVDRYKSPYVQRDDSEFGLECGEHAAGSARISPARLETPHAGGNCTLPCWYRRLVVSYCLTQSTVAIWWFAVAFTYYGISFNISGFGLNIFLTQFIYGAIEIPAKVGTYFVLDRIGRRNGQAWSMILSGVLIGVNIAIPTGIAELCGKGFSEAAFTIAFLYTAELFPTVVRQCGLGYTSFLGRLGGSLAPMLIMLEDVWIYAPPLVFSVVAILSGCVVFLLPETLRARLPETIQDVEEGRWGH
ncbi:hypothetical protein NFI96_013652 [Prochilodus magdalenae]|nr:hypothetical protein NFI96_013652 [Prochilodus magdalenae]